MVFKQALALVAALLLAVPGWADAGAVGTVESSSAATVQGVSLVQGTTVFSGDTINVGPRGSAWIAFEGGTQLLLSSDSQVQLEKAAGAGAIRFQLERGRARFRTSGKSPVEALLADAIIRPAGSAPAVGYIALLSATSATIGAEKGDLLINTSHDGSSLMVREGTAISVPMAPDPAGPPVTARRRGGGFIILLGAAIVITLTVIALLLNSNERKRPVSSSVP